MYETKTIKEKLKLLIIILIPILITQISMNLMTFFDTMMSGRSSAEDLAGVAIGASLWVPISTGINGIVLAITPIIAHLIGGRAEQEIPKVIQQGIYLAIILSIIIMTAGALALDPILSMMDLEPEVRHVAKYYLFTLGIGIIPLFIFNTIRCFMDGLGQTRISMIIILVSLPLNVVFNYIFIFGKLGIPAFGGIGAGIATAITYFIVCIIAFFFCKIFSHFVSLQCLQDGLSHL